MSNYVQIVTKIETRNDEALDKNIYVFDDARDIAQQKFDKLTNEAIVNLSYDYLEDIDDPEEQEESYLIERLEKLNHYVVRHDDYFYFNHKDCIREIEVDLDGYFARKY